MTKTKMNLYLDVDDTIVKSKKRFIEIYNNRHNTNYDYHIIKTWNFEEIEGITREEIEDIFSDTDFYAQIDFYEDVINAINFLSNHFRIHFITIGNPLNLDCKRRLLFSKFPTLDFIGVDNSKGFTKGEFVKDGIMIDDNSKLLDSTGAEYKMLFKPDGDTDYNRGVFLTFENWYDIVKWLLYFNDIE